MISRTTRPVRLKAQAQLAVDSWRKQHARREAAVVCETRRTSVISSIESSRPSHAVPLAQARVVLRNEVCTQMCEVARGFVYQGLIPYEGLDDLENAGRRGTWI